ncbi:MAG: DNA mismatch repair endonuclease MutL [Bacteroidetes bacterium]|nr:DNA mismatch repair endonuclease MutL [Bacteroidota bacterium]
MSNIISLLPDHVANQIAAGEVVQRPASVVKELLENAIDAGATQIKLIVKDAGKSLIQVIDNGKGMSPFDARLCFERHATSKIKNADDLFNIHTKGFRGEALASIAAVAQVELKTRQQLDAVAQLIEIDGGKFVQQSECQAPVGTSFSIKNLFFNIPARRNFLKEDSTELRHIIEEFERVALPHYNIHFILYSNNNELFNLPAAGLIQRIMGLFSHNLNQKLVPIEQSTDVVKISGYVGKPETAKKKRGEQYFFVNNRFIKSPYLNHAVYEAYRELIASDAHPTYYIFLEVDPKTIDVNIHPTKTEIKFIDDKTIYALLHSSVKRALGKANVGPSLDFEAEMSFNLDAPTHNKTITQPTVSVNPDYNPFKTKSFSGGNSSVNTSNKKNWEALYDGFKNSNEELPEQTTFSNETAELNNETVIYKAFQLSGKYIVTSFGQNAVLIDQQRAHERILYEHFLNIKEQNPNSVQQMLFPIHMELSNNDFVLIQGLKSEFNVLGFDLEPFGKNNIVINGTPAELGELNAQQMIEGILESYKLNLLDKKIDMHDNLCRALAKNTCIKYGKFLDDTEMQTIISHLLNCNEPLYSPNGKPVMMEVEKEEIEKFFKR